MVTQTPKRTRSSMTTDEEIRDILIRHWADPGGQALVEQIYHEDVVLEFPQGNERIVGLANVRAMRGTYPASVTMTARRVRGSGALWFAEMVLTYDGGEPQHGVTILDFRDGRVVRETIFVGEPWAAPAWRAQWVEPME